MLVIGLTGGISSGKSTVVKWFLKKKITVLDCDEIVRDLQRPYSNLLYEIEKTFGTYLINTDGSLNRQELAKLIFHNELAKEQLNGLIHPLVKERLQQGIVQAKERNEDLVILDIPLLYESQFESLVDSVVVVYVPKHIQMERLMKRDHIDKAYALAKINSQLSLDEKKQRADFILDNSTTLEDLVKQCENLLINLKIG